jgi:signal transduction histidine kinase
MRMLGIMEDITAQKNAEYSLIQKNEELTKTNRELDSFVYSASHDLRAPIASMLGLIQVARLENDPAKMEALFKLQEKTLKKLDHFIRDIVDHSRNARAEVQCELVQLEQLINESFEQFHFLDNLAVIRRQIKVHQPTPFYSDSRRMQVVFNNLISNAIKYADLSKSQPYILIDATVTPTQAVIRIEDNGEGIAPSLHDRIFEMFFRASGKSSGSGLGLYIVHEVLQKMGGTISLQSGPGEGTTFTLVVPNRAGDGP